MGKIQDVFTKIFVMSVKYDEKSDRLTPSYTR